MQSWGLTRPVAGEARGGDKRKAELTLAAFDLIAEKGLEGFRVRDAAARAGVNIATLHYYFPTKEELVRAVVDHILQFFMTLRAQAVAGNERSAIEQLRAEVLNIEAQLRERPDMFVVMTEVAARAHRDEGIRESLARMDYGWRSYLAAIVMRGHRDGSIRANLDPRRAASLLASLIKGMTNQAICGLDKPDFAGVAEEIQRWVAP